MANIYQKIIYCTAIGDALGLSFEGMSRKRIAKFNKALDRYYLILNKGMVSDDTDHTFILASALSQSNGDIKVFQSVLRRRLMFWLLSLPVGIGKATLLSILKMWCGFPSSKCGIYSAGNGPAMRVAILGYHFRNDDKNLYSFVKVSTELTHTDPKALTGALAVAKTVQYISTHHNIINHELFDLLKSISDCTEWQKQIDAMFDAYKNNDCLNTYCEKQGWHKGISGYIYHTVPATIYACIRYNFDLEQTLEALIRAGGDTDTTAAIAGSIVAATNPDIKPKYIKNIIFYPQSSSKIDSLAEALNTGTTTSGMSAFNPLILCRSICLIILAFAHIFKRALPPY